MDQPRLRPFLAAAPDNHNPGVFMVWDRLGLSSAPCQFSKQEFVCLRFFDGQRSLDNIREEVNCHYEDARINIDILALLTRKLEQALFLDGPRFREIVDGPVREPRFVGCNPGDLSVLRREMHNLFTGPQSAGMPRDVKPDGALRAAFVPHIDYPRGGHTYTWGFKEVVERSAASLFVIIATSHHSAHRFTLTRKHFKTPFGVAPTDQDYIDRLVHHYGSGLFDDEWVAHLPEHSIELEVLMLQFLYENIRPIRIVPLVVGSFHDCVEASQSPDSFDDISRMVLALREVEKETAEPICYIISGDLAHIGPKFGDREPVLEPILRDSRQKDLALLAQAETARAENWFRSVTGENDARRICGFPPAYTALAAAQPHAGKVLHYDQYAHPHGFESVSFASIAYYS